MGQGRGSQGLQRENCAIRRACKWYKIKRAAFVALTLLPIPEVPFLFSLIKVIFMVVFFSLRNYKRVFLH